MEQFTLISGTASAAATTPRVKPISGGSPGSSRQQQNFGGWASAFKALDPLLKQGWQAAANSVNTAQARVGRHKLSAATTFSLFNAGREAIGLPILSDAPTGADLNMPPRLPDILVNASNVAGRFSLTITPRSGAVTNPVLILGMRAQIAGKNTWPDKGFAVLGAVQSLASGPNDIASLYVAKYGTPPAGYEIALRLVAVSQSGLRRSPLLVTGFCAGAAATLAGSDDDTVTLKAA